jgi:hypothetical protein
VSVDAGRMTGHSYETPMLGPRNGSAKLWTFQATPETMSDINDWVKEDEIKD